MSIHFSPAISSILLGSAFFCGLVSIIGNKKLKAIPYFTWIVSTVFIWQFVSTIYLYNSNNWHHILKELQLRLPLLLFPFIFFTINLSQKAKRIILLLLVIPIFWIAVASVIHYFLNYQFLNMMVLESKPIPIFSIVYHIEFSVLLALTCILISQFLLVELLNKFYKILFITVFIVLVFCLHVLSARTGIVTFWMGLICLIIIQYKVIFTNRNYKYIVILIPIICTGLFFIPSIKNRVINTVRDINVTKSKNNTDINNQSFGLRTEAWKVAIHIIYKHKLIGAGMLKTDSTMNIGYEETNSIISLENRKLPHNQFLDYGVQSGIFALVLFVLFFVFGIKFNNKELAPILIGFAVACLFESLLQRQSGILALCVFVPIGFMFFSTKK